MILNILLFSFLFDWFYKMVSPQNGDTWGGLPPPIVTPLVPDYYSKCALCSLLVNKTVTSPKAFELRFGPLLDG